MYIRINLRFLKQQFSLLFMCYPLFAVDIIVDRTRTNQHISVDTAANGVPVVNIARPNANGISHNTYIQFNVPTQGTILNNAGKEVNTQLSGHIYGNENVRDGSASLILNEVSGTSRSRLNGYLEVAGERADVIVANPNGITVNGAGFINIPKATLTTGKVSFSGRRPIFDIEGGDIFIDGKGLDARSTSSLELYTKAIKLNASLHAKDLRVVTGLNRIDENGKVISRDSEGKARPKFSIDSTALGGIYANAISLIGTQKGVGVNLPSEMLLQDSLEISADGKIILGKVSVKNGANIHSNSSAIEISEGVHADNLKLQALTDITLHGNTAATNDLTVTGNNLYNDGLLAAGINADFTEAASGSLRLGLTESINNDGVLYGLDAIRIDTKKFRNTVQAEVITARLRLNVEESYDNAGELSANLLTIDTQTLTNAGFIHARDVMTVSAQSLNNNDGIIEGLDRVTLNIANNFLNNGGILFAENALTVHAGSLEGIEGELISKDQASFTVSGVMNVDEGYLEAEGLEIRAGDLQANRAEILSLGNLNISTENMTANDSSIQTQGNIAIEASGRFTQNDHALLYATGDINVETQRFDHMNASTLQSLGNMQIRATTFNNRNSSVLSNDLTVSGQNLNNTNGKLLASGTENITTATLDNTEGTIQANETLTVSASGDIDNSNGTLYSGTGTRVTAQTLNNEEGFIASMKTVFLDLFNLSGDKGNISGAGVSIYSSGIESDHATIQSSEGLDIVASRDVELTNTVLLSNAALNMTAQEMTLNGSTLYSGEETIKISATTLEAQNAYMEATETLMLNASQNVNISASVIKGNSVEVSTEQDVRADHTSFIANDNLDINARTLNVNNASLFAQNRGSINTDVFNNSDSIVSASQMNINTIIFNNADSHFYADGGTVHITATGTLNNNNGLLSVNGDLVLDAERLDNRHGDLETGNSLEIRSKDVQIEASRFFAGNYLAVTSNIASIDSSTRFLSANAMVLDFAGELTNHGEILANGSGEITVHGDLNNESSITANDSLTIRANTVNNNIYDTGASIRGGYLSSLVLNGNLNNYGFLTSSGNLDITADTINNYAGIAAASALTLSSTNLYNYNTILSGRDMDLYISNRLRNNEGAMIYAGQDLRIAANTSEGKTKRVENIIATISSGRDMYIVAEVLNNIGEVFIDYETYYYNIITGENMTQAQRNTWIDARDDFQRWSGSKGDKFSNLNYWLRVYGLYDTVVLEYGVEPSRIGGGTSWVEFRREINDRSLTEPASISSGRNAHFNVDHLLNRDATISSANNMVLNAATLDNTPTQESVEITETLHTMIWNWEDRTWPKDNYTNLYTFYNDVAVSMQEVGGRSQILAGGTLRGNFGALQNGMQASATVTIDPNAPTISTSTQMTNEVQNTVTGIDTNVNTPTVEDQTEKEVENTPLALTLQVYDPSTMNISLPDNPYGLFVTSVDPNGPLIESNPEYTNYNSYVSSDYMLERLGYDGSSQTRRLGDAMYETQLIRDAIIAMTGQRYIGIAENDNEQYTHLMDVGVNYAQEVGLKLGVPPTALQLENLKEDLVWMEEKTIQGQQVLVPVLYLAKAYSKPTGANIHANAIDLTVDGHLGNTGSISTREDMRLTTGSLTNARGSIEAGANMQLSTIGDIKNLSGSIQGGSVVLSSTQGNIVNTTLNKSIDLQHRMGTEHYTYIDQTASITATSGGVMLAAAKNIDNVAADISAQGAMVLNAGENVNIKTLDNTSSHEYTFGNGFTNGQSVSHVVSEINAGAVLDIRSDRNINLEAVSIHAGDTRMSAQGNVNITAVVDSSYRESHFENEDFISSSSTTDTHLAQSVFGTNIQTENLVIEGNRGVTLESVSITASDSMQITSDEGDVTFTARAYTNAEHHEESSSILGGLYTEHSVDALSETLLSDSTANAGNSIVVDGKNINIVATDLSTIQGSVRLLAAENVNILSGMETRSEVHVKEESGLSFGYSDGRFTFAEETTDRTEITHYTNRASNINTSVLMIESGQDTNVIASNIRAGVIQVDAARDFNVLSDKDIITNSAEHSRREIGVEFTLNSRESSVFAGYWEDQERRNSIQSEVVSSNIQAGSLEVNAQNTNVVASTISGQDININSENIRIISDSTNTNTDAYTHAIKAGVEVGARQNLANVVDAVDELSEAENGSAVAARGLRAYDALQTFAEQPVTAGVTALYEESSSHTQSTNSEVVASSITAGNSLTLNASDELEISGSDVGSANALTLNANSINIHASQGSYVTETSSETKNVNARIYGINIGQTTVAYQENELNTEGITQRNSQLYAGNTAVITSIEDTTFAGANIEARNLELNVGGNLNMQSLQDRQTIEGSSRGGSVSGNVMVGVPTGASANAGETSGERAWVSQITGINGSESIVVNVGGTTTLTGASITNLNDEGEDQSNLELNTRHLVVNDIKDIDTYDSTTAGIGLNNGEGSTPELNSVEYTNNSIDREQITRATIGSGSINTESTTGTVNRDTSNIQEVTRDDSSHIELYGSDRSLALLADPNQEIAELELKLGDVGIVAHDEMVNNLPSVAVSPGEEKDLIDKALDILSFVNIIPTKENEGGFITQIATQLFGDNRNVIVVRDRQLLVDANIKNEDIFSRQTTDSHGNEITVYYTNPDKAVRIDEETGYRDDIKIHFTQSQAEVLDIQHVFTNGMNNTVSEAIDNQQQQQGSPSASLLNYNQTHGLTGDMLENLQDAVASHTGIGNLGTGSARQTGEVVRDMTQMNQGNLVVSAHSQGTMMTQNGMDIQQDDIARVVQGNQNSQFLVQYSGAPVQYGQGADLVTEIYGGLSGIKSHIGTEDIENVFRSQVNPGDPVATHLGFNSAGVNNNDNYGENFVEAISGWRRISGGKDGENASPHSGYPCLIGCGDDRTTVPTIREYFSPNSFEGTEPLQNFHREHNFADGLSNVEVDIQSGMHISEQNPN